MRATSVVSEGFYRHPRSGGRRTTRWGGFTRWDEDHCGADDDTFIYVRPATLAKVTFTQETAEPIPVVVKQHRLEHRRTRVDCITEDEDADQISWWAYAQTAWQDTFGSASRLQLMLNLTLTDARSRRGSYALSFCSVCSVVFVCVVMMSILSSLAVVGLRLAEASNGPVDLVLTPGGASAGGASLNYTRVAQRLATQSTAYQLHSYRVELQASATAASNCTFPSGSVDSLWYAPDARLGDGRRSPCAPRPSAATTTAAAQEGNTSTSRGSGTGSGDATQVCRLCQETCLSDYCFGNKEKVRIAVVEPSTEPAIQVGGASTAAQAMRRLPSGSVAVSASLQAALKVAVGDTIVARAEIESRLRHVIQQLEHPELTNPTVLFTLRVGLVLDDALYPGVEDNLFVLLPPIHFSSMVADALAPSVSGPDRERMRRVRPADCATSIVLQMPEEQRMRVYLASRFRDVRAGVQEWGTTVATSLGANQVTLSTPLLRFLKTMEYFTSFVGLIIWIVVLALSLLSVILIYTLLSIGIETKTYELGVQRMLGFTRMHLVMLVVTNTYFFTVPAWLTGLVLGQLGYWIARGTILELAAIPLNPFVSLAAVGCATLVGLAVPLIAAALPIYNLLSMALPDALDTSRSRATGVVYTIQRGQSREADLVIVSVGFLAALGGMCLYLFFPQSLLSMNLPLLFSILFGVLLGMLWGLMLLATNLQRVLETAVLWVFLFWETAPVRTMVQKSLAVHRRRNRQTTLMYSLSVGFVVFITVAFQIQVRTLEYSTLRMRGADITVYLPRGGRPTLVPTPLFALAPTRGSDGVEYAYEPTPPRASSVLAAKGEGVMLYLEDLTQLEHDLVAALGTAVVTGFAFRMHNIGSSSVWPVGGVRMRTLGFTKSFAPSVNPISPNLYDVVDSRFVIVNKYDDNVGRYGLGAALYSSEGLHKAIVATTTNRVFALQNSSNPFVFLTTVSAFSRGVNNSTAALQPPTQRTIASAGAAMAVMDSSAVFLMTKFPNNMGEVLVSVPAAVRQSGVPYLSCNVLGVNALFLRVRSPEDYGAVKGFLRRWLSARKLSHSVADLTSSLADVRQVSSIFNIFFFITQLTIMLICLFSLVSSMSANVLESSKEIGVLLCLGMSRTHVYRVYVWEAFVLVVASGSLGVLVGTATAATMLMQSALFNQIYVPFPFPYIQLALIVTMGVVSALTASVSPVRYLLKLPSITHILRRVV
ncbi:FtsX-like permease family [Novymonas esmeraldas]|uniref:FtsX-like permease family n=1 Tax=Novymonas esmeraldas TaxID=1808958 RepID=A0AAW0F3L8_9TRYP